MEKILEILRIIEFELLVNVEFWNILIIWILLYCHLRATINFEKNYTIQKYLDNLLALFLKTKIVVYMIILIRIIIIFHLNLNVVEYLYLNAIFFCLFMIWLFFISILYNEIKKQKNNLKIQMIEWWLIIILTLMLVYNLAIFVSKLYLL